MTDERYCYSVGTVVTFHDEYYIVRESEAFLEKPILAIIPIDGNNTTTYLCDDNVGDVKFFAENVAHFIEILLYKSSDVLKKVRTTPWWQRVSEEEEEDGQEETS